MAGIVVPMGAEARRPGPGSRRRTSLVTGATSGIGRETALALARAGDHVIVSGRDGDRGEDVCTEIRAGGGTATLLLADLRDPSLARGLARDALEVGGGAVDVLVNTAGDVLYRRTEEVDDEDFDDAVDLHVRAPVCLTGVLAPVMAARGHGIVVNVTAVAARVGVPGLGLFGAVKAAVAALTRAGSAEFGPQGVRVNAVEVAEMLRPVDAAPAAVGDVISFLTSPSAGHLRGVVLPSPGWATAPGPTAPDGPTSGR
jgi:NAD(P)-dependent dehydrogenase (short-subunit alcohol dehydrogenase family)